MILGIDKITPIVTMRDWQVLDLVLDRDIIEQTTSAGSLLISLGRRLVQGDAVQLGYFCTDTQQVGCTPGDGCACEYPTHTVMHVDDDNGLVYTRYTKIVSYSVGFASVRAGYNHTLDGGYYVNCFDPTVGTNQDADGNVIKDPCYCMTKECNIGVEAGYRYPEWTLLTTVNFIAASQPFLNGVTPNTNHHAPRLDFVPVVYVPWLLVRPRFLCDCSVSREARKILLCACVADRSERDVSPIGSGRGWRDTGGMGS